ncbi:MAG: hypothetical protein H6718_20990 [Polyangiaceae bacterium]|nr:hypothetical protein [Myxococcales bacterium]MCB9587894.1 hypothetical protein [Polyangiaceae bacterium]MCB9608843.1 hypothetical protein [Polyangiaceae bacterium]
MRSVALGAAVLVLVACSKKESADTPQPEPSAMPSAGTAVTTKSAVPVESAAPEQAKDDGADFEVVKGLSGKLFLVGDAVLSCGGSCEFPSTPPPKMQIMENGVVRDAPELWPANAWEPYLQEMKSQKLSSEVRFSGDYPKRLFAQGWGEGRTGEGNLPQVKFFVKYWVNATSDDLGFRYLQATPPREYDEALLSLPTKRDPRQSFRYGADGPMLGAEAKSLWIRTAKEWVHKIAPWRDGVQLYRLTNGTTLAVQGDAYLISKQGEISKLKLPSGAERAVDQGGVAYLFASNQVLKPKQPERFKLAPIEERVASRSMVVKKPSAEDAGADAEAAPNASIEAPGDFSDACKTPVVLLQTSDGYLPRVDQIADVFRKHADHALAYPLYRITFTSGQRYLVRAKDVTAAKQFEGWVSGELKAELKCVDVDSMFPSGKDDRMDRLFVHPWSGAQIELP